MKITEVKKGDEKDIRKKIEKEDYDLAIEVYVNREKQDKQAITINPGFSTDILILCLSRLNQSFARMIDMPYEEFLKVMKNAYVFSSKYENLDLSEEQLQRLAEKEIKGY